MAGSTTSIPTLDRGFLLAGERTRSLEPLVVHSPYDGTLVGTTYRPTLQDLETAIVEACRAFETMRALPSYRRAQVLRQMSAGIERRKEELVRTLALEAGKPVKAGRAEVERAIFTFAVAAEESTRILGEWIPLDRAEATTGRFGLVRRFPIGPIAAITPFNFPLNLVAHKVAPAIACGCTLVHKPASQTPFSSLLLGEIAVEAGLPAGAWNILPCSSRMAEQIVTDDRLKMLTFTGSADVGWQLKQRAGKKRVTLELGGNAGVIVHSDADLEYAADRCAFGGFSYAGQSCISVQRVFVHRQVEEKFLDLFLAQVRRLKVGNPLDETTDVGPMITREDAERAERWVEEAVAGGAELLTGGRRQGSLLEPAVLTRTQPTMKVSCLEMFAPVVIVEPYNHFEEAVERVNDSSFGLQAGVFTHDARAIFRAYEKLEVGGVVVGDVPTFRIDHMPYGGTKDSGMGREGLRYAIEEMTEPKLLVMSLPSAQSR